MEWKPYLRKAQFYETDSMGVVYHGNYIHWMEEARIDFLDQIGWGYDRLEALGVDTIVEIGPGKALSGFVKKTVPAIKTCAVETCADIDALCEELKGE